MSNFLGEEGTKEVLNLIRKELNTLLQEKEDRLQDSYEYFAVLDKS